MTCAPCGSRRDLRELLRVPLISRAGRPDLPITAGGRIGVSAVRRKTERLGGALVTQGSLRAHLQRFFIQPQRPGLRPPGHGLITQHSANR
ncbi:hypothetical protein AAFF_G00106320 [Aldrovandia affinis]|uniref:Uncharacterized protein n=1 Tax=Aldrovandia affinis TaxID=143900 RepID=A0AAD7T2K6_9TELE|nr:hypothetical protein AAFF_G00106320 [Aldrovandia affinis]